ncbi:MAG: hemagglutinin repeat-containing protein, partial [Sporomusaceae bacterium]|nr:hemagglutinin repeat-containing protein [Sporomusaceae bacterium]
MPKKSQWKKIITWLVVFTFFTQPVLASAQLAADTAAANKERPVIDKAANGTPIVKIATPGANGLSHNKYEHFNVGPQGLIFNNAASMTQTQLAGYILGNSNLKGGAARVILNEITGRTPSNLAGYMEVAGQKAGVIIANPNGITGSGFGFINADRVTLTTGTPVFGGSGSLEAFRVTQGEIAVQGAGLDATGQDRVDLISQAVNLNAGIWAKELNVVTGSNKVDYNSLQTEKLAAQAPRTGVSLDVSALGGMYANKIRLIGTEKGVGVNLQGTLAANSGDLVLTQEGKIFFAGNAFASGNITAAGNASIANSGRVHAWGNLKFDAGSTLENSGTAMAGKNAALNAENISTAGFLGAGINKDGTLGSIGKLDINAKNSFSATNQVAAAGDLNIDSAAINLTGGDIYAGKSMSLNAAAGGIDTTGGLIEAKADVTLYTTGNLTNRQGLLSAGENISLTMHGGILDNTQGVMAAGADLKAQAQKTDLHNGSYLADGNIEITAQNLKNAELLQAAHSVKLDLAQDLTNNSGGEVIANKALDIKAGGAISNQGEIIAGENALLDSASFANGDGASVKTGGRLQVNTGSFANQGVIYAQKTASLAAGLLENSGTLAAGSDLDLKGKRISASGTLAAGLAADGSLTDKGQLKLTADGHLKASGQNIAGESLNFRGASVDTAGGNTYARKEVTITAAAGDIDNTAGTIGSAGKISLAAQGAVVNNGTAEQTGVIKSEELVISAGAIENKQGLIAQTGTKDLALNINTIDNTAGQIAANSDNLKLSAAVLNNSGGQIQHAGAGELNLETTGALTNTDGSIVTNGQSNIKAAQMDNTQGSISANKNLDFKTEALTNQDGVLVSNAAIKGAVKHTFNNQAGVVEAGQGLKLSAGELNNNSGRLTNLDQNTTDLAVSGSIKNTAGFIGGNGSVAVKTADLDNTSGQVLAAQDLSVKVTADTLNDKGVLFSGGNLTQSGAKLTNAQGSIEAGSNIILNNTTLNNEEGSIAANNDITLSFTNQTGADKTSAGRDLTLNVNNDFSNDLNTAYKANRDLTLNVKGDFLNQGNLEANRDLKLKGKNITNEAGAVIAANEEVNIAAADNFQNAGSVFADEITIKGGNIVNTDATAAIAATDTVNLYAKDMAENRDGATIFSLGDINIAGSGAKGANGQYTTRANLLLNQSANIEAGNDLNIFAADVVNKKLEFETEQVVVASEQKIVFSNRNEFDESGNWKIFDGTTRVDWNKDVLLVKPKPADHSGGSWDGELRVNYYSHIYQGRNQASLGYIIRETAITKDSASGKITAGRDLTLNTENIKNEMSQITAGGSLTAQGNLENISMSNIREKTEVIGQATTIASGYADYDNLGADEYWMLYSFAGIEEKVVQSEQLPSITDNAIFGAGEDVSIQGDYVNNVTLNPVYINSSKNIDSSNLTDSVSQVTAGSGSQGSSAVGTLLPQGQVPAKPPVQTNNGGKIELPQNGMYNIKTEPDAKYLVETNQRFTNYNNFISSDYMLAKIGYDPAKTLKRLGDGFYEQQLIKDQISELTGQVYLSGYKTAQEQYQALLDNAVQSASELGLQMGVALTAEQAAQLKSDIVWLEKQIVNGHEVLVPVVYLSSLKAGDLKPNGSIISGENVKINVTGTINNAGTIKGINSVKLGATDVNNLGGSINGGAWTQIDAAQDILNLSGTIGGKNISLTAGRDFTNQTAVIDLAPGISGRNKTAAVGNADISAGENLSITAGRDFSMQGASLSAGGDISISSGRDFKIGAVETKNDTHSYINSTNYDSRSKTENKLSSINAGGSIGLQSGGDMTLKGVNVSAKGDIGLVSAKNLSIESVQDREENKSSSQTHHGFSSSNTSQTENKLSTFSAGGSVGFQSGGDLSLKGVNVSAKDDIGLVSAKNLSIEAVQDTAENKSSSQNYRSSTTENKLSSISAGGSIGLQSGDDLSLKGVNVSAANDLNLSSGKDLSIETVKDESSASRYRNSNNYSKQSEVTNKTSSLSAGGSIGLEAAGDMTLTGAQVTAGKDISALSGGNLLLDAVKDSKEVDWKSGSNKNFTRQMTFDEQVTGTNFSAGGDIALGAKESINLKGSSLLSEAGSVALRAGKDITVESVSEEHEKLTESKRTKSGFFSKKVTQKRDYSLVKEVVGSTISGEEISLVSGADIKVKGSGIVATGNLALAAGNDINIESSAVMGTEDHYSHTKKSGIFGGGSFLGITIGSRSEKLTTNEKVISQKGSTVGSLTGDVTVNAG